MKHILQRSMIELLIDTNIYRSDPLRNKASFNAVVRLAKSGKIRLHVPYFVQWEFISQQIEHYEKNVNSVNQAISNLQRKPIPAGLQDKLEKIKEHFLEMEKELTSYPETEFISWMNDIQGVLHPISEKHGERVAKSYFDGTPPFKAKKNRDDIPDAFIWQAIVDLSSEHERLFVIAGDNEIRNACETISSITAFNSLDGFITSDICRPLLKDENVKENTERLLKYLPIILSVRQEIIETQLAHSLEGSNLQSNIVPNSTHVATISNVEELKELKLEDISAAEYYGQGVIVVPFTSVLDVSTEYEVLIADYQNLSAKRSERIAVTELDKYRYIAEESYSISVTGKFSITVDTLKISEHNLSNHDIRSLVDYADIQVDSILTKEAIDWDPIHNSWEQRFLEMLRYKRKYGNCEIPHIFPENPSLGHWVSNQKQRYRIGKLSKDRIKRLNEIGFTWRVHSTYDFDGYVEQLLEYEQIYGHMNVSQLDTKYRKLGRWLNNQRTKKSRGTLPQAQEDRLNEIGIVWNVIEARWAQRLDELSEFHKQYGHFDIPTDYREYPKLYDWSRKLRRRKPTQERLQMLQSIGYDWDKEHKKIGKSRKNSWDRHVNELKKFYDENGHFNVPYSADSGLVDWLYRLRKNKPTSAQLAQLESIGFDWQKEASIDKLEQKWNLKLNELRLFYEANGHFSVPFKENPSLYRWLYKIKKKKPSEDRIKKLQAIGFYWQEEHNI